MMHPPPIIATVVIVVLFSPITSAIANTPLFEYNNEHSHTIQHERNLNDALKGVDQSNLVHFDLIRRAWHKMDNRYREHIQIKVNRSREYVRQLLRESGVSSDCHSAINHLFDSMGHTELWAMQMWNSWGKFPPPGFFEGSFTDLGSFNICLNIQDNEFIGEPKYCTLNFRPLVPTRPRFHSFLKRVLELDPKTRRLFRGDYEGQIANNDERGSSVSSHRVPSLKYRTNGKQHHHQTTKSQRASVDLESSLFEEFVKFGQFFYYVNLQIGSCWPSKCSQADIEAVTRSAGVRAVIQVAPISCVSKSERNSFNLNKYQLVALAILGGWLGLVLLASCLDLLISTINYVGLKSMAIKLDSYLDIFSLQRNFNKLFSPMLPQTKQKLSSEKKQPRQLPCINGIKILSMIWIIFGHTLLHQNYQSFTHIFESLFVNMLNFLALPALNTNFSVDTFFVISGLLSTYVIFSLNIKFNGILFTAIRYLRLTPQLAIVILLFFLLPLMGNGPLYKQGTQVHADRCYKNYWLNFLYLQSYINRIEMCMVSSWWLSIEMTFHIISLPVIYMLTKRPKIGLWLSFGIAILLTLIGALFHYNYEFAIQYLPTIPQRYEVELEQTQKFFHRPYPHAASYFFGLVLGYILAKKTINRFSGWQLILGWFVCLMGFAITLCASYYWNLGKPYTQLQATIYYNICQVLWPISICWIILVCSLGQGGFVDDILSANFFVPLGRITYMTYLSHMIVVYHQSSSVLQVHEPTILNLYRTLFINIILSLVLGTIVSLVYETPIKNLQNILFNILSSRIVKTKPMAKTKLSPRFNESKDGRKDPKFKRRGFVNLNIKS